ncbi:MAG: threonylcarbamoyl-AMP synthase [Nitrospira sp.]|nr:MAG: threonylcarbamoyl-AMP synthase [Nitrospira sp.]
MPLTMVPTRRVAAETMAEVCREAGAVVRRGGVIAMPTESFYAFGADPWNGTAVERVCALKGRPTGKPILVLLADGHQVAGFARHVPPAARALMDHFWPGPLTIVLPAVSGLPALLTAGTDTIGLRWSACRDLRSILDATGPLTGTSANRSGDAPACAPEEVTRAYGAHLDLLLDAGPTAGGPPSTLVDLTGRPRLLREGAVSAERLRETLARFGESLS